MQAHTCARARERAAPRWLLPGPCAPAHRREANGKARHTPLTAHIPQLYRAVRQPRRDGPPVGGVGAAGRGHAAGLGELSGEAKVEEGGRGVVVCGGGGGGGGVCVCVCVCVCGGGGGGAAAQRWAGSKQHAAGGCACQSACLPAPFCRLPSCDVRSAPPAGNLICASSAAALLVCMPATQTNLIPQPQHRPAA